jgi:hypothetical protein
MILPGILRIALKSHAYSLEGIKVKQKIGDI